MEIPSLSLEEYHIATRTRKSIEGPDDQGNLNIF
jgi:hypothetical protein